MKERLEFDNLKTGGEVIQEAQIYYQETKQKGEACKNGPGKKGQRNFQYSINTKVGSDKNLNTNQETKFLRKS